MIGLDEMLMGILAVGLAASLAGAAALRYGRDTLRVERDEAIKRAEQHAAAAREASIRIIKQLDEIKMLDWQLSYARAERDRAREQLVPFKTFNKDPGSGRFVRRAKDATLAG